MEVIVARDTIEEPFFVESNIVLSVQLQDFGGLSKWDFCSASATSYSIIHMNLAVYELE